MPVRYFQAIFFNARLKIILKCYQRSGKLKRIIKNSYIVLFTNLTESKKPYILVISYVDLKTIEPYLTERHQARNLPSSVLRLQTAF